MAPLIRSSLFRPVFRPSLYRSLPPVASTRRWMQNPVREEFYNNIASAEGVGRCGPVTSLGDTPLTLRLTRPKSIGGTGTGQTPEQLLAMGFSSCFLHAIQLAASKAGKNDLGHDTRVHTNVIFGPPDTGFGPGDGFTLSVEVTVEGVDDDDVILAAHDLSPFSKALTDGIPIKIRKMESSS